MSVTTALVESQVHPQTFIARDVATHFWEIFSIFFPKVEDKFKKEAPHNNSKHLKDIKQHAAIYYVEGMEETIHTGRVKDRRKHHAEKDVLSKVETKPRASEIFFYSFYSPCGKCIPLLAEFINGCQTWSKFALFIEKNYKGNDGWLLEFLALVAHKEHALETKDIFDKEVTMILLSRGGFDQEEPEGRSTTICSSLSQPEKQS